MSVKVIMAVHIYGRRCDMNKIHAFAKRHGLYVIEDLAEAHGVAPHPETHASCYSFYRNKIVAGEEGGAVAFRDPDHARLARQLRNHGFTDAHDFTHVPRGCNYRLANSLASLIIDQLRAFSYHTARSRWAEARYEEYCPSEWKTPPRDAPWVYDIRIPGMVFPTQDKIVKTLNEAGIAARHAFKPMSWQGEYNRCKAVHSVCPTRAAEASSEVIYLPFKFGDNYPVGPERLKQSFEIIQKTLSGDAMAQGTPRCSGLSGSETG